MRAGGAQHFRVRDGRAGAASVVVVRRRKNGLRHRDFPAAKGLVSRVTPVHTAMRNSTRDEGGPFEVDNQVLISSHRKLLWSKAMVVSVAEKPKQDSGRHD